MTTRDKWTSRALWAVAYASMAIGWVKVIGGGIGAIDEWSGFIFQAYVLAMVFDIWRCRHDN